MRRVIAKPLRRAGSAIRVAASLAALALLAAVGATPAAAAASDALWGIVHGLCATNETAFHSPAPCAAVDLADGWAVLKDIRGETQHLLIPTARVSGIESRALLASAAPNYFEAAWRARAYVFRSLGRDLPRDDIGLAVNSEYGRSQNQLHIHIDCVDPSVRAALVADHARIGARWTKIRFPLAGHRYRAMRLYGADFGSADPFKLLAEDDPGARADMGRMTLAAIGATFADGRPGFYLLSDRAEIFPPDRGSGEDLLDHSCRIAH